MRSSTARNPRLKIRRRLRSLRVGGLQNTKVGRILRTLGGFDVLHDLDLRRGNVDHVVIGPTGVYVIETKAWRGRVYLAPGGKLMRSGMPADAAVRQARANAELVRNHLASWGINQFVIAVIALTNTTLPKGEINLRHVHVVEAGALPTFIRRHRQRLLLLEVERIREALAASVR